MKIAIISSGNKNRISPFVKEQARSLSQLGINVCFFQIVGKGALGYLSNMPSLYRFILKSRVELVHAHYGLSGMLAVLQRIVPVVITFHGSDVEMSYKNKFISSIASRLSQFSIYVNQCMVKKIKKKENYKVIPCGVDIKTMIPINPIAARQKLGLDPKKIYILFSGAFNNKIKNYKLAKEAVEKLSKKAKLIELRGYSREGVKLLMNACDCLLVTSIRETGPLVAKEAMACNCPIVSTDVGDVRWVIGDTAGCYLTCCTAEDVSEKLMNALDFFKKYGKTEGRKRIIDIGLDSQTIALKIVSVYETVISGRVPKM